MKSSKSLLLPKNGQWIKLAPAAWKVSFRPNERRFALRGPSGFQGSLPLGMIVAIEVSEAKQVRAVGKTLGRMALTGLSSAMSTNGNTGSVGAGLLDLSFRGSKFFKEHGGRVIDEFGQRMASEGFRV